MPISINQEIVLGKKVDIALKNPQNAHKSEPEASNALFFSN